MPRINEEEQKQNAEASDEFFAGTVIAGKAALEKAALEEYNSPEALAQRLAGEVAGDPRAKQVVEYMTEGEPDVQGRDIESEVLRKQFENKRKEEAGVDTTPVKPEPRADGMDVVVEQINAGQVVNNPKLTAAPAGVEPTTLEKKSDQTSKGYRRS